ncbi:MAG: hypothetical protein R3E39_19240 [Anaerolineae bacterium]
MNPKEELFERFGKQLVELVRDKQINVIDGFLEMKGPFFNKYKDELSGLSPAQIEMINEMAVIWVDGTLHDMLFLLESSDWIKLRLQGEITVLEDIREAERGDLQGYIYIWAEKYSTKRLIDYTNFIK